MSVIYGLENVPNEHPACAVAIGVFDGVHWGHRAIFIRLLQIAKERGLKSVALTFDKHPAEVLAPTRAPLYISTLDQRVELIKELGVDEVVVVEFGPRFAYLSKEDFIHKVLSDKLHSRHLVVGSNFLFGKDRQGDIRYLSQAAPESGIDVDVVSSVIINGGPVSSTRIRSLIGAGDMSAVIKLLGRRFTLRGTVIMGRQVGRTLGFPTANLKTAPRQILPARGVYAVESVIENVAYSGVCNIGCRPTFDDGDVSVEVHFSGFQGNIYGETLDVAFCRRLRDEMTFESPEKLADQIRKDIERAGGACA